MLNFENSIIFQIKQIWSFFKLVNYSKLENWLIFFNLNFLEILVKILNNKISEFQTFLI